MDFASIGKSLSSAKKPYKRKHPLRKIHEETHAFFEHESMCSTLLQFVTRFAKFDTIDIGSPYIRYS